MNNPIVSIIIPCYNVERYVTKCIHSIMEQTYRNIEILAIEDESTDNTSDILDKIAKKDDRVTIVHKKNEGVSIARNSGIEKATGDYIVFVDGDDYLSNDYVEYMLQLAQKDNADFVLSLNCYHKIKDSQIKEDSIRTLTPSEATALLLSKRVIVGCWNKMFKKDFLVRNNHTFSTKLFYGEGLNFIIKAAQLSNCVTSGERRIYYYRRNNELSVTSKFNIRKYHNGENALNQIESELIIKDKAIIQQLMLHKSIFCIGALSQIYAHSLQLEYKLECKHWKSIIQRHLPNLLVSANVSLYAKALLLCGYISPKLISMLDIRRRKRISNESVD